MKRGAHAWLLAVQCAVAVILPACSSNPPAHGTGAAGVGGTAGTAGSAMDSGSSGKAGSGGAADSGPWDASDGDTASCAATDIVGKLSCIRGLTIVRELAESDGVRHFDLTFDQPADHGDPSGVRFKQSLRLRHRAEAVPMVLGTSGYELGTVPWEIESTFGTNALSVEHRFFRSSIPDAPRDWRLLSIQQASADFHAVALAFKSIYKGRWLNTGGSKGGMAAIYHRRSYPADFDATVSYVPPNFFGLADHRYVEFLRSVGGDTYASCREALRELQKVLLIRRAEIEPLMPGTYESLGGNAIALEHGVLEIPFTFWQFYSPTDSTNGCPGIPAADAAPPMLLRFLMNAIFLRNHSDSQFEDDAPFYYQLANQLGHFAVEEEHLAGLLQHRETYRPSSYIPKSVAPPMFDPQAMIDVQNWVRTDAETLMFIHGELDPCTAGKFELDNAADSYQFIAPGANHRANLAALGDAERARALSILQRWLGIPSVGPLVPASRVAKGDVDMPSVTAQ